jgi:NAD(P)-dependent dehydrogenase (short-subunit alcohol dehydrogenase family)
MKKQKQVRKLVKKLLKNGKLSDRVRGHAVVFGGSGGIGVPTVEELVAQGIDAISFSYNRNREAAEKLAEKLKKAGMKKVFFDRLDPSDEEAVKRFLKVAVEATGVEITSAVYAIGVSPNKPFEKQKLETVGEGVDNIGWREVYEVNVFGCMVSMRAVAKRMKKHEVKGTMVFITSTNGINSHSQISAHYDSSKAAQSHLMRIMAEHYARYSIRINGVAPGWVNTSMNKSLPPSELKKEMRKIWSGRFGEPHEIARFIVFILSEEGSYTYGQDFMVDGGYRTR